MTPVVSINGQFVTSSEPALSVFDRGFTHGDGIFETLKCERGELWYLDRHLERMRWAARRVGLEVPGELRRWAVDAAERAAIETDDPMMVRLTLTRGGNRPQPLAGSPSAQPTMCITVTAAPQLPLAVYQRGLSVQIAEGRRNDRGLMIGIKSTSYAESILALRDAEAAGFDDALFLDTYGFVSEATASNIFAVVNGALITPAVTHGILLGITRSVVLELTSTLGIDAAERELGLEELRNADEAFLTSSVRGIIPLVRVEDTPIGDGVPGEITHRIMTAYEKAPERM